MSSYLFEAMKNRIEYFFLEKVNITVDAAAGSRFIKVDSTSPFSVQGISRDFNNVLIWDNTTTGKLIQGGYQGADLNRIENVSNRTTIKLEEPLTRDFPVSQCPILVRAPGGVRLRSVILGDVRVRAKYPAITVVPKTKNINWTTMSGTTDKVVIDFMTYVKDDDTQDASLAIYRLTDALEWLLMSNLHIVPLNSRYKFEVTSKATVTNIDYGNVSKGSEFLKASRITWEADQYFWRMFTTAQGNALIEKPGPGSFEPSKTHPSGES